jgi:hypothetical protein
MQNEAVVRMNPEASTAKVTNTFHLVILFNIALYLSTTAGIVLIIELDDQESLISRTYKAVVGLILSIWIFGTGVSLVATVKRFYSTVPKLLNFWLLIGVSTAVLQIIQQLVLYFFEDSEEVIIYLLFFSYNAYDLFPAAVFIKSFQVYGKFFGAGDYEDTEYDEDISIMNLKSDYE